MVVIHIANINVAVIGGVQSAVPQIIKAQSRYVNVGLVNTYGDIIDNIKMLKYEKKFDVKHFPPPFDKPDIVIFHEVYRFEYIKIYRFLRKYNIPYIVIPHGCLSKTAQRKKHIKKFVANLLFFNSFIKCARSVQYLSDNEKNMSVFLNYNSFVSGNGVSIPQEKKRVFSKSCIKFVYIGRLELYIKGLDLLLNAVKKCETLMREHSAKVNIFGPDYNGSHKNIVYMIKKLNISDLVNIEKEKVGKEKEYILFSSDCFIQTSRTEGLPLGPLEALSYGLPCIVTDGVGLGGIIESFGAGYKCSTSEDGIAEAIQQFIKNIDNEKIMSQSAVKLVEKEFDINLIAKKTLDKYCEIINR